MLAPVHDINKIKFVCVLDGAVEQLVAHRELRNKYQTNRSIKTWATFFLLKSLTSSGIIANWTGQKQSLLAYCKLTENSFRSQLASLQQLKLITLQKNRSIKLTSFETAAEILGIDYTGLTKIEYDDTLPGKQIFQYFLRAEDIRSNQYKQLDALCYYAGKNPLLKNSLLQLMAEQGSDSKRLAKDPSYFQQQLLQLQKTAFKQGSPLLSIIHELRADINRGVNGMKDGHKYKSAQSVSYMKKVMRELKIITVTKTLIESKERTRLYIAGEAGTRRKDAYKWLPAKQVTAWVLTDQIAFTYKSQQLLKKENEKKKVA